MIPTILTSIGGVLVAVGLLGLFWCIRLARRAQSGAMSDEELKGAFSKISAVNMASMGGATLGLAMILVGLIL